jgi:hypothetical protein
VTKYMKYMYDAYHHKHFLSLLGFTDKRISIKLLVKYSSRIMSKKHKDIEWGDLILPGKNASFVFDR